jgi:AmmeMemoRadiSam system protein B
MFGHPVALSQALEQATMRTVWEDTRFPPVSPTEIDQLQMEVWLLHDPQRVEAHGEDRLQAITIGKHGVQVVRGQAHGLFLPSVAIEGKWDARRLLDQVCLKAGLPPTAWKEDDTALFLFEGEALHTSLAGPDGPRLAPRRPGPCRQEDLATYTEFCRSNLQALMLGATPNYYLFNAPDGTVSGVVLSLQSPGRTQVQHFSQFSLRPGIPLQATLFNLVQSAVPQLHVLGIGPESIGSLSIGLTVLHDAVLHGTVADPHLSDLDPQQRAVMVLERSYATLLYDPTRTAEELVAEAASQGCVKHPATASIFSLDVVSNICPVSISTIPRPVRGPAIRPAAVAGTFYPADPEDLTGMVKCLLSGRRQHETWPAALVPHAGLKYSGRIAAAVLERLAIPRQVIIIGPKHTAQGMEWAVAPHQTWALPGLNVESDFILARRLCQAIPGLEMDAAAHHREHAIEVQLPLLAHLAPEARVVGIVVGHSDLLACRRFAQGLAGLLRASDDVPLLLISSDMNHFATDAENRRLDALALAALERCNPDELYQTVMEHHISMCGALPAVIVLETLRLLGQATKSERVAYATSAEVSGDTSRVVGYAGMLFG